jgi:uncharacterized protein (TIGR02246 family)
VNQRRTVAILALSICILAIPPACRQANVDTRAEVEKAIRAADAANLKAAQDKDVDRAVANYAEDATWLAPNAPIAEGREAIRAGWAKMISSPGFDIDWQMNKLEVSRGGNLAYALYTYQLTTQGPDGKPITDHGKDLSVWKKEQDGNWKIVADSFNSDLPVMTRVAPSKPAKQKASRHKKRPKRHSRSRRRST